MKVARKNVELDIDASDLKHYKSLGFTEIDENGNYINVEKTEIEKLKEKIKALEKENEELKNKSNTSNLTKDEVIEILKEKGIEFDAKAKKDDLLKLLK